MCRCSMKLNLARPLFKMRNDACGTIKKCSVLVELAQGLIAVFVVTSWIPGRAEMSCRVHALAFSVSFKPLWMWVINDVSPLLGDWCIKHADALKQLLLPTFRFSWIFSFAGCFSAFFTPQMSSSCGTVICFLTVLPGLCGASSPAACPSCRPKPPLSSPTSSSTSQIFSLSSSLEASSLNVLKSRS